MTDLTDLHRVLAEATDHVRSPDLTDQALASASRRRARRTTLGALVVVVLLGGGVAWAVQDRVPRAGVVDTPSPSPVPTATPSTADTDPATQPVWDPFSVVDAPRYPSVLPERIEPPAAPPSITEAPLPDIVLAWPQEGSDLRVLGTNGEWRIIPGTATAISGSLRDVVTPAISPQGDRVAMAADAGILVVGADGSQDVVPWPPELEGPFDTRPPIVWRPGDEGFIVLHWERPWLVDLEGNGEPAAFGAPYSGGVMVDPDDGTVLERRWRRQDLVEWQGDAAVQRGALGGYGERFVTRFGLVAYTGSPEPVSAFRSGPIVVDADTADVVAYAPIRDANSVYSDNAHLTALGFLDEVTVLLLVTPMDFRRMRPEDSVTHLVTWDFRRGDFGLIASGRPGMRSIAVAPGVIAD